MPPWPRATRPNPMAEQLFERPVKVKRLNSMWRLFSMGSTSGAAPVSPASYRTRAAAQEIADQINKRFKRK